jgi:hypothetical protein
MTREEYREKLVQKGYAKAFVEKTTFPELLIRIAADLFKSKDSKSELAKETRRRLNQLANVGWTD